jgi:hypothetical protein
LQKIKNSGDFDTDIAFTRGKMMLLYLPGKPFWTGLQWLLLLVAMVRSMKPPGHEDTKVHKELIYKDLFLV